MSWGRQATSNGYLNEIAKHCEACPDDQAILELGSGHTTGIIHKHRGKSKALSLEHSEQWYKDIISKAPHLREHVRLAKPKLYDGGLHWFYDLDGIEDLLPPVYLVICDGPPGRARVPGLFKIYQFLAERYVILMDDYERKQYQNALAMWANWDDCSVEYVSNGGKNDYGILIGKKRSGKI